MDVALRYLAARPRSEAEVRRRLTRSDRRGGGFSSDQVEATLTQLRQHGLLDDARFAQYWLEQRRTFRPRGARLLQAELRQRGIASDLAAETTAALADDSAAVAQDAYRAARKRALQLADADERTFRTRIGQFLARRGFDWETIAAVTERLWLSSRGGAEGSRVHMSSRP
ncbi:MAG TPA: regulatory protein RecX [Chloroflexota bacterium]|nr:regulatory protein RecX [Chloroflexota bacterium]